jgi:hypothetical protein
MNTGGFMLPESTPDSVAQLQALTPTLRGRGGYRD